MKVVSPNLVCSHLQPNLQGTYTCTYSRTYTHRSTRAHYTTNTGGLGTSESIVLVKPPLKKTPEVKISLTSPYILHHQIYFMKKYFFLGLLFTASLFYVSSAQAQGILKKAGAAATNSTFDVKSLTTGIMNQLTPSLSLTDKQKPGVTDAISTFLTNKSGILSLKGTDPKGYETKQNGLLNTLKSSLGKILLQQQMNKFLGLKPAKNDPKNILSNLFY